jgi:hypothetical protein
MEAGSGAQRVPLTALQKQVLQVLAANRSEESHFARINPRHLETIQARQLDPVALKRSWIAMSDRAESQITRVADTMPQVPIGVAFVDPVGVPGWIGRDPELQVHPPSVRGCWPRVGPESNLG